MQSSKLLHCRYIPNDGKFTVLGPRLGPVWMLLYLVHSEDKCDNYQAGLTQLLATFAELFLFLLSWLLIPDLVNNVPLSIVIGFLVLQRLSAPWILVY